MEAALLRLEKENGAVSQVEVDEMLRFFDIVSTTAMLEMITTKTYRV